MKLNKIFRLYFFSAAAALSLVSAAVPFNAAAQGAAGLPKGVSQKEWENCQNFYKLFNINPNSVTPGREGDFTGNFVKGLPFICSAQQFLLSLINLALLFAGSIAVLFIIVGGYWYITSAGNEEQAEKGRKTLVNSIIGLVVIIMSSAIIRIVINTLNRPADAPSSSGSSQQQQQQPQGPSSGSDQGNKVSTFESAAKVLGEFTVIPDSLRVGQYLTVSTIVGADNEPVLENLRVLCDQAAPTQCPLKLEIDGREAGEAVFSRSPTHYNASITVRGNFSAGQDLAVSVKINNTVVASGKLKVQQAEGSLPGGEGAGSNDKKIQEAANRSSFTAVVLKDKKSIKVDIDSLLSDKLTICQITDFSRLSEGIIEVYANGYKAGQDYATANSIIIEYPSKITDEQYIVVNICGNTIGGGTVVVKP